MFNARRLLLLLCCTPLLAQAHDIDTPGTIADLPLEAISERIHVVHGTQVLPNPATRGFMNNPAAILTDNGIIVIDPGSSVEIGRELLDKLRAVSTHPVIAVFNTHVHGDHWLGNQALRERYPDVPIYAHVRMLQHVAAGAGDDWIGRLTTMTEGAVAGTRAVGPSIGLKGGETLKLDGITLRIHHTGHAHTDHDLMIEVVEDSALFCGDIVASGRVPNSDVPQDASFKGTLSAIEQLLQSPATLFIPGHGRSGGRDIPQASLDFLRILTGSVSRYYQQDMADFEMKPLVLRDLHAYRDWHNFDDLGRVISYVYQEVEVDSFGH